MVTLDVRLDRQGRATDEMKRFLKQASDAIDIVIRGKYHHNFSASEATLTKAD